MVVKVIFAIVLVVVFYVVIYFNVMYLFAGALHYHATKTGRTAGSNPCL